MSLSLSLSLCLSLSHCLSLSVSLSVSFSLCLFLSRSLSLSLSVSLSVSLSHTHTHTFAFFQIPAAFVMSLMCYYVGEHFLHLIPNLPWIDTSKWRVVSLTKCIKLIGDPGNSHVPWVMEILGTSKGLTDQVGLSLFSAIFNRRMHKIAPFFVHYLLRNEGKTDQASSFLSSAGGQLLLSSFSAILNRKMQKLPLFREFK